MPALESSQTYDSSKRKTQSRTTHTHTHTHVPTHAPTRALREYNNNIMMYLLPVNPLYASPADHLCRATRPIRSPPRYFRSAYTYRYDVIRVSVCARVCMCAPQMRTTFTTTAVALWCGFARLNVDWKTSCSENTNEDIVFFLSFIFFFDIWKLIVFRQCSARRTSCMP